MTTHMSVGELVAEYDPFWYMGFQPIVGGGFEHLDPIPLLVEVERYPLQTEWTHNSARGLKYDLGRYAYFVAEYAAGRPWDPITISHAGDGFVVDDGHHRLSAAWLLGLRQIAVSV